MAQVDLFGNVLDLGDGRTTANDTSWNTGTAGGRVGPSVEEQARTIYGGNWDADAAGDFQNRLRNGQSPEEILAHTAEDFARRFPGGRGGGSPAQPRVPNQFDDPYSTQLEDISKAQMGELRSNPDLNATLDFLRKQFSTLSASPGFTPDERAMLATQALEPIEQRRQASNTRALERAGARGFLPSSGLTYLTGAPQGGVESLDTSYDRMRTGADRDLALANVQQRRADLAQAAQIGQLLGLDIPRSQRAEELSLARGLYQMPRDALADLLAVLGGSPGTNDLFNQANQGAQQSYQDRLREDERNAALMEQIGGLLSSIFR